MRTPVWVVGLLIASSTAVFGQGADFYTLAPCRVYDSRDGDGPFLPGEQRELQVATGCGVPYDAVAVTANLTAVDATASGGFTVFPDSIWPTATNALSFRPGVNVSASGIYPLARNGLGTLSVVADGAGGQAGLVLDVTGYFLTPGGTPGPSTVPLCVTGTTVPVHECWEGRLQLSGSIPTDDKTFYRKLYHEARIKITFTRGTTTKSTYAYWDGGLNFGFRAMFPRPGGTWTWTAVCESGCQQRTLRNPVQGTVTVGSVRPNPSALFSRGPLKVDNSNSGSRLYLKHQNGLKFFWLGDTAWAAPMRIYSVQQYNKENPQTAFPDPVPKWTDYLDNRRAMPGNYTPPPGAPTAGRYSVIQVALAFHAGAGPYTACLTKEECFGKAKEAAFVTTGTSATIPGTTSFWNLAYWKNLDALVDEANEKGLVVVLTGVMDPFGGGRNDLAATPELENFARNLAARMAGFYVIYSVGWDNRVEEATYSCGGNDEPRSVVNGFSKLTGIADRMNAVGVALYGVTSQQPIPQLITTHLGGGSPFFGDANHYHDENSASPTVTAPASPYSYFHRQDWLAFHLFQSGQCDDNRPSVYLNTGTGSPGLPCGNFTQEGQLDCVMRRARTMPPRFLALQPNGEPPPVSEDAVVRVKPVVNGEARYERTSPPSAPPVGPADIAYQSRHAGHLTTLSGASGFTGGVYNVGEWRWPGDNMGITGPYAGKSPDELKNLSVLMEGQIMAWETLRRKEGMLSSAEKSRPENERSVVAASTNNKTIVAYLPHRDDSQQRYLELTIDPQVYVGFDTSRWSKKWWNPVSRATPSATPMKLNSSTFKFTSPSSCSRDRCDWILLLSDLGASAVASGQIQLWSGLDDSTGRWGVFVQQWLPSDEPGGPVVPVGELTDSVQAVPQIGRDTGQQALVAWVAEDTDGEGYGIVARRLDGFGTPVGDLIRVSDPAEGDQVSPSVAAMGESGYVVTWTAYTGNSDQGEVYARYFDFSGAPLDAPFQVNLTTTGEQSHPMVAADPRGNVVIAWESWGQDGDGNGVFARRFNVSHNGSEEFQVYRAGAGWQYLAGLSTRSPGRYEVRWQVYTPLGHDLGTWGQRLKDTGPPRDGDEYFIAPGGGE